MPSTTNIVLLIACGAVALAYGALRIDKEVERRFAHRFATVRILLVVCLGIVLINQGLQSRPLQIGGSGVAVLAVGGSILAAVMARNIARTGFAVGLLGSLLQFTLGPMLVGPMLLWTALYFSIVKPVYVVNANK
ncbi:MAG: hypothetical protein RL385_157 [Pseudomonadota bacterium]|jgi:hypothetical protein